MAKYLIEYHRDLCIGCGACVAITPDDRELDDEGKADIKKANKKGNLQTLEINEKELQKHKDAAQACPAQAIKIKDLKTGKYLV
ncbi:MAG: ferredoxin [Candidatus Nanoarchaeia archaeon]